MGLTQAPRWLKTVLGALAGGALLYGGVIGLLWSQQERLLFRPSTLPADFRFDVPTDVQERWVEVPGARLNALHLRLPKPDGVVFYLHGNAGDLSTWFVNSDYYRQLNLDLYILDYRGFGKSSGHIQSQAQLLADVRAAWQSIAPLYAGKRRIIAGRSIGTGLAAALAAEVQPELTVLISPYFSLQDLASSIYPWVPGAVLRYPLRTDLWLPRIRRPVLLTHGEQDQVIPIGHSERLLALSPRAALLRVPQAAHNDIQRFPTYLDGLARVLQDPERVTELRSP